MDALFALLRSEANTASALAALASAVAALLAGGTSIWAVLTQRRHNELSVRPLAEITYVDFESSIRVKLRNHGTGPMIVLAITVSDGSTTRPTLLEWMPELPNDRPWTNFTDRVRDRSVPAGGELILLELTQDEGETDFAPYRDPVRAALAPLVVNVEYTDIYNNVMRPHKKPLSWFGRHGAA